MGRQWQQQHNAIGICVFAQCGYLCTQFLFFNFERVGQCHTAQADPTAGAHQLPAVDLCCGIVSCYQLCQPGRAMMLLAKLCRLLLQFLDYARHKWLTIKYGCKHGKMTPGCFSLKDSHGTIAPVNVAGKEKYLSKQLTTRDGHGLPGEIYTLSFHAYVYLAAAR